MRGSGGMEDESLEEGWAMKAMALLSCHGELAEGRPVHLLQLQLAM
jgi:hypothetical protein